MDEHPSGAGDTAVVVSGAERPCDRCGAFTSVTSLGTRKLCDGCIERLLAGRRFWSSGYLVGAVGALLNPAIATTLLAINYHRLEERALARSWALGTAGLIAAYGLIIAAQLPIPRMTLAGVGLFGGLAIAGRWRPTWHRLRARSATSASWWLPLLVVLGAGLAVVVAVATVMVVLGLDQA